MSCLLQRVFPLIVGGLVTSCLTACDRTGLDVIVLGAPDAPITAVANDRETSSPPGSGDGLGSNTTSDISADDTVDTSSEDASTDDPAPDDWETWGNAEPELLDGGATTDAGVNRCTGSLSLDQASYRIRARGAGCLTHGETSSLPTPAGVRISATELLVGSDCESDPDAHFRLVPGVGGWFELLHQATQLNVDVLFADYAAGTSIVLYEPHGGSVQWFRFTPARNDYVSIASEREPDLCLARVGTEVELAVCAPSEPEQEWLLLGPGCAEDVP